MHTKLAKENRPSSVYSLVVHVVRDALSRQDEVVVPLTLTRICMYVCMFITYSRVWINRVRLPVLLVVS